MLLRKTLLYLAIALPVLAISIFLADLHLQSKVFLDGPLATPFNKAHAIRELGTAFFISAFAFLLISNIFRLSGPHASSKIPIYLKVSATLIAISVFMFLFLPYFEMGFGWEFYFPNWSSGLKTIHHVIRDLTLAISAIFIAKQIKEVN